MTRPVTSCEVRFAVCTTMASSRSTTKFKTPPKRNYFDVFLEIPFDNNRIQLPGVYHKLKVHELKCRVEHEVGLLPEMYYLTYLDDAALDDMTSMADNDVVANATLTVKPWRLWAAVLKEAYKGNILKCLHVVQAFEGEVYDKKHFAWVALYIASHRGHFRLVAELIKKCPLGINARSPTGWTVLHAAARKGHWAVLCILLDQGSDIQIKDQSGRTPFDIARLYGKKKCEQSLNFCEWNYQKHKIDTERKTEYDAHKARDVACRRTHMSYDSSLRTWMHGPQSQLYMAHLPNAVNVSEVRRFDKAKQRGLLERLAMRTPDDHSVSTSIPSSPHSRPRRGAIEYYSDDSDSDDSDNRIYFDYGWFDPIRAQEFIPPTHDILRYSNPSSSRLRPRSVANPTGYVEKLHLPSTSPISPVKSADG